MSLFSPFLWPCFRNIVEVVLYSSLGKKKMMEFWLSLEAMDYSFARVLYNLQNWTIWYQNYTDEYV